MSLTEQLSGVLQHFNANAPEDAKQPIIDSRAEITRSFDAKSTVQVGDAVPDFHLLNAVGKEMGRTELLAKGPLLITFYRGEWCPFCNLALAALQKRLDDFTAKGVTLVAISPELPNESLTIAEKNALKFEVLSDVGNQFARKLGLVWKMPDSLRPVFKKFGNDLSARNGDDSFEVPIPANFLVDENGIIKNMYINPDYTERLEPEVALRWVDELEQTSV